MPAKLTPVSLGLPSKFKRFRSDVGQLEIIMEVLASRKRFFGAQLSPGMGKTLIYTVLVQMLGTGIAVLNTKPHQNQLLRDFSEMGLEDIRGHSNYDCGRSLYDDEGTFLETECALSQKECLFQKQLAVCAEKPYVCTNSALVIQLNKTGQMANLGPRDIGVFDEAHLLRARLTDSMTVTLTERLAHKYLFARLPNYSELEDWQAWLGSFIPMLTSSLYELLELAKIDRSKQVKREIATTKRLLESFERVCHDPSDWIVFKDRDYRVKFVPLDVSKYAERFLFAGFDKVFLTSATIFKEDMYALGIEECDLSWMERPNPFPVANRLVFYVPSDPPIKVDAKMSPGERRVWHKHIDYLIEEFFDQGLEKGIIMAHSYDRASQIFEESRFSDVMLIHKSGAEATEEAISRFKRTQGRQILVSPAVEEGHDFPYELCRWIIIPKVPFLDLRDPIVAARHKRDKNYMSREVVRALTQIALRGVRASDDRCLVVIIDHHFTWFRRSPLFFPWFADSFRSRSDAPQWSDIEQEVFIMRPK